MINADEPSIVAKHEENWDEMQVLYTIIAEYNEAETHAKTYRRYGFFLHDNEDNVIGGVGGYSSWGGLHIETLAVKVEYRKRGYGTKLLEVAEEEGVRRGCRYAHLDTMRFQAMPFYKRNGYKVFGTMEGPDGGYKKYFMSKILEP